MNRPSLNHTFRLVWSTVHSAFVAVAESTRGRGRAGRARRPTAVAAAVALMGLSTASWAVPPGALPTGAQITAGQATMSQQGSQLTIQQGSASLITNWQSFNIGRDAAVRFVQPSANATALNRVLGSDPSHLFGQLSANGRVFLINPNGVLFGASARVDAGALVASTLQMSDADFLAGRYRFDAGPTAGGVQQLGEIAIREGGFVALIGSTVDNQGSLVAPGGHVALAAGGTVELALSDSGLIGVQVQAGQAQAQVSHSGFIAADGGRVWMTARQAAPMIASAINQTGVVRADTVQDRQGQIWLDGGPQGQVALGGQVLARGQTAGSQGGTVVATGDSVVATGEVDASGRAGGGQIYLGGGWQGQNPAIAEARQVDVQASAQLKADAQDSGSGGTVVAWSSEQTRHDGAISAQGVTGTGGQVETSSRGELGVTGSVRVGSASGLGGLWLLDPTDVTIVSSGGGAVGTATVNASSIEATLNTGGSVTVQADNDIFINADISKTNGATLAAGVYQEFSTLTFDAGNNITLGAPGQAIKISATNNAGSPTVTRSLNVNFQGPGGAVATGTGLVSLFGEISTNGGSVNVYKPTLLASTKPIATQVEAANTAGSPANTTPDSGHVVFHQAVTLGGTGSVTIDTQSVVDGSQNYLRRGGNITFHGQITSQDGDSPRDLVLNTTGAIANSFLGGNANYSGGVTFNGRVGTQANPLRSLTVSGPSQVFLNTDQINLRRQSGTTLQLTAPGDYISQLVLGQTNTTIAVRGFDAGSADYVQNTFDIVAGDALTGTANLTITSDRSIQIVGTQAVPRQITGEQADGDTVALNVTLAPSQREVSGSPANSGAILLQNAAISSQGGDIQLGSASQRAYGVATEQNTDGVRIQASTVDTRGTGSDGDIAIYGHAATSSSTGGAAVNLFGATSLHTATGDILIDGRVASTSGGANKDAVLIGNRGQATVLLDTTSGSIQVLGDASATPTATVGASYNGVEITDAAMLRTVSGNIEVTGLGGGGNNNNVGENVGIKLRNTDTQIVSQTGNITLTGVTGGKTTSYGISASGDDMAIGQERATDTAKTPVGARPFTGNVTLVADTMSFVNSASSRLRVTGARSGSNVATGQLNLRSLTDVDIQIGGTEPSPPSVPGNPLFLKSDWFSGANAVFLPGFGEISIGGFGSAALGSPVTPADSTGTLTVAGATTVRDPLNLLMNAGSVQINAPLTVVGASNAARTLNIQVADGVSATTPTSLINVDALRLAGSGDMVLSGSNLISTVAVDNGSGLVRVNNAQALTVGTVTQTVRGSTVTTVGVSADDGGATLSTTAGNLVQRDDITASGLVSLRAAAGAVTQNSTDTAGTGTPIVTANELLVSARDSSTLSNANQVSTFAGRLTGNSSQTLRFTSATGITVASLTDAASHSVNGLDAAGTVVLTAQAGGITQSAQAVAGQLALRARDSIDLSLRNGSGGAVNLVGTVAAESQIGQVKLLNNSALEVGTVDGLAGIRTVADGQDITVATRLGDLVLGQAVVAGSVADRGTVRVEASQGSIVQSAAGLITADTALVRARNSAVLDEGNQVGTLAAHITGASQGLQFGNAGALVIGAATGTTGLDGETLVAAANGVQAPGIVRLEVLSGNLTQTQDVSVGSLLVQATTGSVDLSRSTNQIAALAADLEGAGQTLRVRTAGNLAVGTVSGQAGIDTNDGTVVLRSGGALSQTEAGRIVATSLRAEAVNTSALGSASNNVGTVAAAISGANQGFTYTDANSLTVGTVDGLSGVVTNGGDVNLRTVSTAAGQNLVLAQAVDTGGSTGTVTLQSVGGSVMRDAGATTTEGRVRAAQLAVRAATGIRLDGDNTVGTVAGRTLAGDLRLSHASALQIGTVGDVSGLTASGQLISIVGTGALSQTSTGLITADRLAINTTGDATLTATGNRTNTLAAETSGSFRYRDAGSVTIGSVDGLDGIQADQAVWVRVAQDLTVQQPVSAQAAGAEALVLAATQRFTNRAGATALSAPNGRWLVYDDNPLLVDRFNGLPYDFRRLRTVYDGYPPNQVAEAGNGYITTAALVDPDQGARQIGGSTVEGNSPGNHTTAATLVDDRSAMNGDGALAGVLMGSQPVQALPLATPALQAPSGAGLGADLLPQAPLRAQVVPGERFLLTLPELLGPGRLLDARLADGSALPGWLMLTPDGQGLVGAAPTDVNNWPTVRLSVKLADGSEGTVLVSLLPRL